MKADNMLFFIGVFILGVILVITSQRVDNAIKSTCTSTKLRNSNKGILVIGMIFVVSSISYLSCHATCKCGDIGGLDTKIYLAFCMALGIILTVLSGIISSESSGNCDVKGNTTAVLIIGIMMIIGCPVYFAFSMYKSGAFANLAKKSGYKLRSSG